MITERTNEYEWAGFPGGDLVAAGTRDLGAEVLSEAALLVLIAAPRLRNLAIRIERIPVFDSPVEHVLYARLEEKLGTDAHSRYNSLLRRMSSFAHALEREKFQKPL